MSLANSLKDIRFADNTMLITDTEKNATNPKQFSNREKRLTINFKKTECMIQIQILALGSSRNNTNPML